MNKQTYIHLHQLYVKIKQDIEETEEVETVTPEYDELDITPTSLHASKNQHKEAIQVLSDELSEYVDNLPEF